MIYELRWDGRSALIELVCDGRVIIVMTPEQARHNAAKLIKMADSAPSHAVEPCVPLEVQPCRQQR